MPIHDWTRVDAGLFHHFHQRWISALSDALNAGLLPRGYAALAEQTAGATIPDVLTLRRGADRTGPTDEPGGFALATAPPQTRIIRRTETDPYAGRANRIAIRHRHGQVVAVIEIVSPGNKASRAVFRAFLTKAADLIAQGIHLLVVDLFPPTPRDPSGIHKAIWDEFQDEPHEQLPEKPLTLASYAAGLEKRAYVELVAVGDELPDMPLFLEPDRYIRAPLAETYRTTWEVCPEFLREAVLDGPSGNNGPG